jgi:hypothetical protein
MTLHPHISPGDEQQTRWWPNFRDVVSPHRHEQVLKYLRGKMDLLLKSQILLQTATQFLYV